MIKRVQRLYSSFYECHRLQQACKQLLGTVQAFFASLSHLVQPLFARSSCHGLSDFLIRMTRNMVSIRYFYAHGTVCIRSEGSLCSASAFVTDR